MSIRIRTKFFSNQFKLNEWINLSDLKQSMGMSDFTKKTRKQRNKEFGTENKKAKLIDVKLNEKEKYIDFYWLTEPTYPIYPKDYVYKNTNPKVNFKLEPDNSKTYTLIIRVIDFFEWLSTYPDKTEITEKDIKDIFDVSYIQVWSDDPSFHWQGMNYWISQLDGSIYPTKIKPKRWNSPKLHGDGNAFVSKHLGGLINNIRFWYNPMASMLTNRLRKAGYIEREKGKIRK